VCILFYLSASATIIIPFDNLGHLTEESTEVVIATVTQDHFYDSDRMINYSWSLEVEHSFKNQLQKGESLFIGGLSSKSTTHFHNVLADIKLEVGKTYLLFLNQNENTLQWQPRTMAMYVYELMEKEGHPFYVPTLNALDACKWGDDEPHFVMEAPQFNDYLAAFISNNYRNSWDDNKLKANIAVEEFHPILKAAPAQCVFLFDGASGCGNTYDGVRWQVFPDDPVEVHIDTEQQYTDSDQEVSDAITDMTAEYEGVNLSDEGIVSSNFTPTCEDAFGNTSGVAGSSNYASYCSGLNGGDNFIVVFDDPCDEIAAMSGCSGTLAIGGLFGGCGGSFSDNHDGGEWLEASNGYIVVNQGAECLTTNDFKIMLTHEMTHALGFGHISTSQGTANMNPSCCNDIASLDIDCLDYLYEPAAAVPVTWNTIDAFAKTRFNAITWSTSSEINNEVFQIEYSQNGTEFRVLGEVNGSGNSSAEQSYSYNDYDFQSTTVYYRIKQVDFDGNYSYSQIVSVQRELDKGNFKMFPNPANNELTISSSSDLVSYKVTDVLGNVRNILDVHRNAAYTTLDISELNTGLYYLEVTLEDRTEVKSFLKL